MMDVDRKPVYDPNRHPSKVTVATLSGPEAEKVFAEMAVAMRQAKEQSDKNAPRDFAALASARISY